MELLFSCHNPEAHFVIEVKRYIGKYPMGDCGLPSRPLALGSRGLFGICAAFRSVHAWCGLGCLILQMALGEVLRGTFLRWHSQRVAVRPEPRLLGSSVLACDH